MQPTSCPLCGADDTEFLFDRLDHTHSASQDRFRVVRCRKCSMGSVNPRPDENEIHEFYPPEFYDVGVTPDQLIESKRTSLEAKATCQVG